MRPCDVKKSAGRGDVLVRAPLNVGYTRQNIGEDATLTKHFSVLCILSHDVQHVFGLHDLRGTEKGA